MKFRKYLKKDGIFFLLMISFNLSAQAQIKYETRGVWIATVKNIDWPKSPTSGSAKQETELISLIDNLYKNNINTIIFQVRPSADAYYNSAFEPWSEWLTGEQGKAPEGFFDPLHTMVLEAHKRGMQVHAWINPYRLVSNKLHSQISENHLVRKHPEWTVNYGNDIYANPGLPEVRKYIAMIVADLVKKYDIDAIHMDDYFYPYPIANETFNDSAAFKTYGGKYFPNQLMEWRIYNVNATVKAIAESIKKTKPHVQFGIAPFGIWRNAAQDPRGSATNGLANYDHLYADVLYWMEQKWVDYVSPQIYWPVNYPAASFQVLADWWNKNNHGIMLYTGHAYYMAAADAKNEQWRNMAEIPNQIEISRNSSNFGGVVFYNTTSFLKNNSGLTDSIVNNQLKYKSFPKVPQTTQNYAPTKPSELKTEKKGKELFVFWESMNNHLADTASYFAVYLSKGSSSQSIVEPIYLHDIVNSNVYTFAVKRFALFPEKYTLVVTGLNRFYKESNASERIIFKAKLKN